MASYVQIANLAGTLIGTEARVSDPADNRVLPRTVKAVWDLQRRATIRDGEFNFSLRRAELPALAGVTPRPFGYRYQLPAAALRLVEVLGCAREDYQLEGREILCNAGAPLLIRYSIDVVEPASWDDVFADAFAKRIAWTIGKRIAGSAYDERNGERVYRQAIADTKSVDARENPPLEQEESGWVSARFGVGFDVRSNDPLRWG